MIHLRRLYLTILLLACSACADDAAPSAQRKRANVAVGEAVPAYAAPTLDGDTISLAQLRGSVVMLNVWATWCPPCREEMPSFQRLHEELGAQGLRLLAVSVDNRSAAGAVRTFLDDHRITFTVLHDPDEVVSRTFRTIGVPETFLISRNGMLLKRWLGEVDADAPDVRRLVMDALGESAPPDANR